MKKEQSLNRTTLSNNSKDTKSPLYSKPDSVKYLENLVFEAKKLKYPTIPVNYLAPEKFRDNTANGLTRCIKSFIQVKGGQCERICTTGRQIDNTKIFTDVLGHQRVIGSLNWIKGNATNGSADISATINGRSVKIEVKIGRDRMSEAQMDYKAEIEAAGGVFYVAMDFTSFLNWYNQMF